jgi:putative two-component system response regulator
MQPSFDSHTPAPSGGIIQHKARRHMDSKLEGPPEADILVVDDNPANRLLMQTILSRQGYSVRQAPSGEQALEMVREALPDLVLLDVMMPGLNGYDVCRMLRDMPQARLLPIIMVTALQENEDKANAADAGADDFVTKPLNRLEISIRVRSLLRIKRLVDALDGAENTILALARALEARDPYTRGHSERVGLFGSRLADLAGLPSSAGDAIRMAGIMHDVGKIGICEDILHKPAPLTDEEWLVMRRHPVIGAEICAPLKSIKDQLPAIRHHHEHWSGGGYPNGLHGEEIPIGARITSVCDAWDAMTSDRPYRKGMPHENALQILAGGSGSQWDESLIELFISHKGEITDIAGSNLDSVRSRSPLSAGID